MKLCRYLGGFAPGKLCRLVIFFENLRSIFIVKLIHRTDYCLAACQCLILCIVRIGQFKFQFNTFF